MTRSKVGKQQASEPIEHPAYAAPALDKGLDILELLSSVEVPLNQREIAAKLGRSVGEIYRMLTRLVERNYISQVNDSYRLTTKLFELAHRSPLTQRLLAEALPMMQALSSALDQSCHLTIYGQGKQIVIAKVDTSNGMGFGVRTGAELDVIVSVSGRVLLAFQDEPTQQLRILETVQRSPAHANPLLSDQLARIRERGFESAASLQIRGLYAVSYPILDSRGHAIAALTVPYAERIDQVGAKTIPDVEEALGTVARRLSKLVGGSA